LDDSGVSRLLAGRPVMTAYLAGLAVMLAVLIGIALKWPRVFASVIDEFAAENRFDRRLLLGAVVVMWSIGWPVTLAVLATRTALRTARGRR